MRVKGLRWNLCVRNKALEFRKCFLLMYFLSGPKMKMVLKMKMVKMKMKTKMKMVLKNHFHHFHEILTEITAEGAFLPTEGAILPTEGAILAFKRRIHTVFH